HEIGHSLGLVHGEQDYNPNGTPQPVSPFGFIGAQYDDIEYSLMNYPSYIGQSVTAGASEGPNSSPQTYMMYDIAALQYMYGANFSNLRQNLTYTWDPKTGQEFINGVGQGVPATDSNGNGKIFETIWTGGANSTFDLSNFNGNATFDMRP